VERMPEVPELLVMVEGEVPAVAQAAAGRVSGSQVWVHASELCHGRLLHSGAHPSMRHHPRWHAHAREHQAMQGC
jgi:hypothetical protein